jgi:putative hydrolase of the HAD superfamily
MPGLWPLLQALQRAGIKRGLITNGGTVVQNLKIDALGIRPAMTAILVSEAVGLAKPDPRVFHLVLEQLGVAPSQAVYVGDHPLVDVQGASDAGLTAIWLRRSIPWPVNWSPPVHQVDALADVMSVIRALR